MNNIKKYREMCGMTQDELSQLVCVDRVTIANWEGGKTEPRLSQALKLAEVLGTTVEKIAGIA